MPLYSDSANYYYSGGSSQLYSLYYPSSLTLGVGSSTSGSSYILPSTYTYSYSRPYAGSYKVPLTPPRSSSYSSSSTVHGLSSRYQPKLTTITESSALSGRHSGQSCLMPLTRIQSPKYTSTPVGGSSSNYVPSTNSASSMTRYIPPRPIAINTADIDVSSARYQKRTSAVPEVVDSKAAEPNQMTPGQTFKPTESIASQIVEDIESTNKASARRFTIKRNRAVVRLSTIRSRSKERVDNQQPAAQCQDMEEHQFRDLPPSPELSLRWRQKLAEELAAFPVVSNKKSPGELLRERFYIYDEKDIPAKLIRTELQQQPQPQLAPLDTEQSELDDQQQEDEEEPSMSEQDVKETIRRLSLVQCPTFHDICEDISSDKIDDDLNAGELRRRASIIQEQEQEILNKLQKSNSGTFQLIHLERRSSHDSTTADEGTTTSSKQKKRSKKLRHKITAIVNIDNAPSALHMPSVLELNEESLTKAQSSPRRLVGKISSKPKFTVNVEAVEEHHEIHKVFKLPKKRTAQPTALATANPVELSLPEGFMKAAPKAKMSPLKKLSKSQPPAINSYASAVQIFTFDAGSIAQNKQAVPAAGAETSVEAATEHTTKEVPIRKALQKSESGKDFRSQICSRETPYMSNRKKALVKRLNAMLTTAQETTTAGETPAIPATIKSEIVVEPKTATTNERTAAPPVATSTESLLSTTTISSTTPAKATATTARISKTSPTITTAATDIVTSTAKSTLNSAAIVAGDDKITIATAKTATALAAVKLPAAKTITLVASASATATKKQSVNTAAAVMTTKAITTSKPKEQAAAKEHTATEAAAAIEAAAISTTTTGTYSAPKINTRQIAKSPEQASAVAIPTKINKTTHYKEQKQQHATVTAAATVTATVAIATSATTVTTLKQRKETKTNFTETVEQESKVQSPKTIAATNDTADKTRQNNAVTAVATARTMTTVTTPAIVVAKNKATTAATITVTATATPASASAADSNVTPINADQFITVAPAKTTSPGKQATNASSPAPNTTAAVTATPTATAFVATTAITIEQIKTATRKNDNSANSDVKQETNSSHKLQQRSSGNDDKNSNNVGGSIAAVVAAANVNVRSNGNDNSCDKGVGNNLSKFATVSNLAQCLRDVDAELEDYIPSSAENSDDDDSSSYNYSSADGCVILSASMKKKQRKEERKAKHATTAAPARFDPQKKIKIDCTNKCYVKEEAPRYPLVATPRPLWKREKIVYSDENTDDSSDESSEATGGSLDDDSDDESEDCTSTTSEEYDDEPADKAVQRSTEPLDDVCTIGNSSTATSSTVLGTASVSASSSPSIIRMSTCSNDSGFEGGTAPSSPKKMLECDVNCHKKCERLTANLCGINQKLIVEALNYVKRGARDTRDSPSTPPSSNPTYEIEANEEHNETSYTYSQFQKSGRFTAPATVIPRFKNYSVDDFHFLAVLGKGSFGKVLLAELRETTYYYAVKCLKKDVVLEDDDVDSTLIERKVLALGTKHPYLCHLFCTFQTESHLFFVMEYLNGGDLMFHIQDSGRFSEERARFYGAEIISGLKFLHKKGIIYRDLKLDNVLLDYEGHVRIADFGMCKLQIYLDKTADSFCGTPDYMAPEIIKGEKYNQNVDWWSFGVLLYEMLIGQSPFSGCDEDELFWSICNEIPWFPVYITADATGILKGLLEKDYAKRIGSQYSPAGDIAEHIFFRPIDWNLLEKRQIEPPFRPHVKHPLDTQYFDRVFTRERVRLTPIDKEILASMDQKQFNGFTYTNPHITLD